MAKIVGVFDTSHIPAIGKAIADKKQQEEYWKPFFDGFPPVREWLGKAQPTTVVIFYNDHGLNFFLNQMPTFAIGVAPEYHSADEGWGIPVFQEGYKGNEPLSWRILNELNRSEFDMVACQEMVLDHAATIPLELLWPEQACPVKVVPINVNTVLFPTPSPTRCKKLGQAVGRAIESWDADERVLIMGTGGLSHQLEGKRAGFMNKKFDEDCMEQLVNNVEWFDQYSSEDIVELAGTQGLEVLNWIASRAACPQPMRLVTKKYHIPISNTASCSYLLEPES